jgi:hypothetical protein
MYIRHVAMGSNFLWSARNDSEINGHCYLLNYYLLLDMLST